jgi:hypothetical protein
MNIAAAYRLDRIAQQEEGERPMLTYLALRRVAFTPDQQSAMLTWQNDTVSTRAYTVPPINAVLVACDGFMMAVAPMVLTEYDDVPDHAGDQLLMHGRTLKLMRQYRNGPYVTCTIAENHIGYGEAVRFPRWSNWRPGAGQEYPNWVQVLHRATALDPQQSLMMGRQATDMPTTGKRFKFHLDPERAMTLARALNTPGGLRFSAASNIDGMLVTPSGVSKAMIKAGPMTLEGVQLPLPPFGCLMPRRVG